QLAAWYSAANGTSSSPAVLAPIANNTLAAVKSYLDLVALAVNAALPNSTVNATTIAGYRTDVSTARTEVGAAITALTTAESGLQSAENALALAQAGSTSQTIAAQQAAVQAAQAQVASAQVGVNHSALVAPFAGVVQNVTAKVGQVVTPGAPVLSLV